MALRRAALAMATVWTVLVPSARSASLLGVAGMITPFQDMCADFARTSFSR